MQPAFVPGVCIPVYLHKLPDAVGAMLPEEGLQRPDALHRQPVPVAVLPGREEHPRQ